MCLQSQSTFIRSAIEQPYEQKYVLLKYTVFVFFVDCILTAHLYKVTKRSCCNQSPLPIIVKLQLTPRPLKSHRLKTCLMCRLSSIRRSYQIPILAYKREKRCSAINGKSNTRPSKSSCNVWTWLLKKEPKRLPLQTERNIHVFSWSSVAGLLHWIILHTLEALLKIMKNVLWQVLWHRKQKR